MLDFVNPFSFILNLKPPLGGHTCLHYGQVVSEDSYPPAEEVLGGSDIIMVPRVPRIPITAEFLWRIYRPFIEQNYEHKAESKYWDVWTRRESPKHNYHGAKS